MKTLPKRIIASKSKSYDVDRIIDILAPQYSSRDWVPMSHILAYIEDGINSDMFGVKTFFLYEGSEE
jgi:hypothetical protein